MEMVYSQPAAPFLQSGSNQERYRVGKLSVCFLPFPTGVKLLLGKENNLFGCSFSAGLGYRAEVRPTESICAQNILN